MASFRGKKIICLRSIYEYKNDFLKLFSKICLSPRKRTISLLPTNVASGANLAYHPIRPRQLLFTRCRLMAYYLDTMMVGSVKCTNAIILVPLALLTCFEVQIDMQKDVQKNHDERWLFIFYSSLTKNFSRKFKFNIFLNAYNLCMTPTTTYLHIH